jgi:hypothetical protein
MIRSQKNVSRVLISADDQAFDDRYLMKTIDSCAGHIETNPPARGPMPPPFSIEK